MQQDEVIWQVINQGFCSYRIPTESETFCKNEYSVNNLCRRGACPLANSNYATVREHDGVVSLYIKVVERSHMPKHMWEKIKLSRNFGRALEQINEHLEYWPKFMRHKCKQRLAKLHQMLHRMRKLAMKTRPRLVRIHKKAERRERTREEKAERAARVERGIERELLARLGKGVYGDLYHFDEEKDEVEEEEREEEREEEVEYVEELPEDTMAMSDDEDIEDMGFGMDEEEDEEEEPAGRKRKRPSPRVTRRMAAARRRGVEWEVEDERDRAQLEERA